ncbi:thiamine phosphate synthase [Geodermatophilus poikilotrophus]|uniref:Thiamine-phosphate synthase n=1 Tax=Geodermatophilus poikilotrophus TaxID=1333667 RepID=A0A1I0GIP2_9ACTN|nr:thiamine phosphate synthase [Geodermatophilus poikilotrophus]SET71048.1 thiamine-phosphate diphosphorylase [Geodermatophilus poikilotrophus]
MSRPFDPTLYLVTDTALARPRPVADVVRAAVAGGVTTVQVRDKTASRRELLELTRAVQAALADRPDVTLWVNDAVDVALLAGADGVHLGQDDLPPAEVRALLGPGRLLGFSVSSVAELDVARALPVGTVDVVGIGPVWTTPTKPDAGSALGPDGVRALADAARAAGFTTVAIGGIDADRAAEVAATGVDGVCVVSAVCTAPDPAEAARALRASIDGVRV